MYNHIQKENIQYLPQNVFIVKSRTKTHAWTGLILISAAIIVLVAVV